MESVLTRTSSSAEIFLVNYPLISKGAGLYLHLSKMLCASTGANLRLTISLYTFRAPEIIFEFWVVYTTIYCVSTNI